MTPRQQFRSFRRRFKLTQKQLAIALGISRRAVIYIEKGRNKPGYETWAKFQKFFKACVGIDIAIFGGVGPKKLSRR